MRLLLASYSGLVVVVVVGDTPIGAWFEIRYVYGAMPYFSNVFVRSILLISTSPVFSVAIRSRGQFFPSGQHAIWISF